ncbi:serine-rich adhesin for platelets [Halyomorpha halys]|uniref:serine-rich adhesin for platelets n=1 Tax=Halyomorpha halys TaxID=286706 RepID=UPI000D0C7570|nr:MATH and LRR domain-containing protein PFE0570w-like [Halyomorpha halys]XP_024216986.1 MATH and LRR domain-containing protein PFE0570w-like [Halyomorpha halys]
MSRNSSVAVLADCTDLSNIHDSLLGLNGPPSVLSIENETILTNNSDISPSQVIGSGSFLERVKSTDLATLFPRGSLNQKRKKKKKSSESSLCISQSSENISSLQSNINVTETDENVSASFEGSSENKKMEPDEKSTKPFNKHLYLRKKSVNISLDSSSLNNSISEKSLKRNSRVVNVSLDPLYSKRRKITETDENISDSFKGSRKSNQIKEESSKVFSKRSYLKKKSVNFSFDSSSLNNSVSEKSLETDQINKISLPSKRKNASRKCKLNSDLNIDDLEAVKCSEKNYTSTKGESIPSSNIDSSYIQSNKETNGSQLKSAKENEFDESISRDNVNGSLEAVNEESPKVFNKNVYLKKKSINISFDSSSLNNSIVEKSHEENSPVSEVSLDPSCSKIANVTGSVKNISAVAEVSQKMEIDKESANVFNKNLFLKKKPIDVTFDSSSINDSITEKISEGNSQVENVSLELSSKMEIEDSAKIFKKDLYIKKKSIKLAFDSSSLSDLITEKSLGGNNVVTDISLDPLSSEITNALKSTESVSKELIILKNSDETTNDISNGNLNASNTVINNSSENDNDVVIDKEKKQLTTENHQGSYNEVVLSKDLVKETTKDGNTELMEVQNSNNSVNDSVSGCNLSQSSQICNAITNEDENRSIESEVDTNISLNDLLKAMDEGTDKVSNKNLCLKESIDIPFESSSLSDSISEKSFKRNILVTDVSSGPLSSEIANATDSSADSFKSLKLSFDSSSSNDPISEKSLEENSPITEVTLDPSCSEITNVTESVEKVSAPFRDAQKMIIEEDSAKVFNKNLYLKKKSIKLSFDSSSLSDPITEKSHDGNSGVTDSSSDPLSSKITNVTESALNVSASSEGSPKMENEEESAKVFCKNLYLKKKSINLTFDSSTLNDLIPEKNLEENSPPTEVSLNLLCPKTANVTESVDNDFASVEGSPKMEVEEESAKVFNKNMYLKKKSIKLTFDSSSLNDAIPEMCPEQYAPVTDVPVELMSSKIVNNTDSAEDNSFGGSQKIEIEEGSVKVFNKNLYLKKKSIKLSFDESSLNDPVSEKSNEENHQVDNSTLDPISSKSTKIIDLGESTSATFLESRKMEIGEESAEVFNKNLYLKKKSVNISFDESSMNDPVPEKNNEENHQVDNGSLDPISSKSTKIIDLGESTSATFQESQKMELLLRNPLRCSTRICISRRNQLIFHLMKVP